MMMKLLCGSSSDSNESLNANIPGSAIYHCTNYVPLPVGYAFILIGKTSADGDRFIIDFKLDNNSKDIALRVAVRASTNTICRNSRIKNNWGLEDTSVTNPFQFVKDKEFEIQLLFAEEHVYIAFNGLHIAQYAHRAPFTNIRTVELRGEVTELLIEHKILKSYPRHYMDTRNISRLPIIYSRTGNVDDILTDPGSSKFGEGEREFLPLPYYAAFDRGFLQRGYSVTIKGLVSIATSSMIKVSLQTGQAIWPQPIVSMQLEFCFSKKRGGRTKQPAIIVSSYINGEWTKENKTWTAIALRLEGEFYLVIASCPNLFAVRLNNEHILDIPYNKDVKNIDTCLIDGAIKLIDVFILN